jgi:hypothetical protein
MTNPTTNFGWVMPSPTDLVTDLPADFEVFGQAVDTDFVDLLGGANGYILSKASATDLDFAWIPNDQGDITAVNVTSPITGGGSAGAVTIGINAATTSVVGAVQLSDSTSTTSSVLASTPTATKAAYDLADAAIAKSTVTTAGDIIYRNATVPVRLGIGTAGQVLKVNSGATAPEWATNASSGLTLITRQSFTNVTTTTTTFDSVFSSTYTQYLIRFESMYAATAANDLHMQMRTVGTTYSGANYHWVQSVMNNNASASNYAASNATKWVVANEVGISARPSMGELSIGKVGNASEKPIIEGKYYDAEAQSGTQNAGYLEASDTYTGFILSSSSTNITGTVSVYGLAKS